MGSKKQKTTQKIEYGQTPIYTTDISSGLARGEEYLKQLQQNPAMDFDPYAATGFSGAEGLGNYMNQVRARAAESYAQSLPGNYDIQTGTPVEGGSAERFPIANQMVEKVGRSAGIIDDTFRNRVTDSYQKSFGRNPEESELEDWAGTGLQLNEIQNQLDVHPYRNRDKAITQYYQDALQRTPEQSEIEDWKGTGMPLSGVKDNLFKIAARGGV